MWIFIYLFFKHLYVTPRSKNRALCLNLSLEFRQITSCCEDRTFVQNWHVHFKTFKDWIQLLKLWLHCLAFLSQKNLSDEKRYFPPSQRLSLPKSRESRTFLTFFPAPKASHSSSANNHVLGPSWPPILKGASKYFTKTSRSISAILV